MRINKDNEKYLLSFGLRFVALSYVLIQFINNISFFTTIITDILIMLKPFIFAFLLAYILSPIVKKLERSLKIKRIYAVLLTYVILVSTIIVSFTFVLPMATSSFSQLLKELPNYLSQLQTFIVSIAKHFNTTPNLDLLSSVNSIILDSLPTIHSILTKSLTSALNTTISAFSFLFDSIITIICPFYILLEQEAFINTFNLILKKLFKPATYNFLKSLTKSLHTNIGKYLVGKMTNSLFVGVSAYIGLNLFNANYAGLLSILLALTNMLPYIGPLIGTAIAIMLNIFTNPTTSLIILIYMFIIQQIESFILEPKTIGKQLGLNPFLTIFAISIGGKLFGIPGMILGVPVASLIKTYLPIKS